MMSRHFRLRSEISGVIAKRLRQAKIRFWCLAVSSINMLERHHYELKIDKFGDFSSDIDYNCKTEVFRDGIYLIINKCELRRPKGAYGGHKVSDICSISMLCCKICQT